MAHEAGRGKGRGSLVTLLSKQTVDKVIDTVSHLIQHTIANEVREAKMFFSPTGYNPRPYIQRPVCCSREIRH